MSGAEPESSPLYFTRGRKSIQVGARRSGAQMMKIRWLCGYGGIFFYQNPPQVSGNTPSIPDRVGWRYAAVRVHPAAGYIA